MSYSERRAGAEVKRMRSMWDSIETHCFPVDRMAAFVISHKPWWLDEEPQEQSAPPEKEYMSIQDVVDVTRQPPAELKNMIGYRSKYHTIVGFSHRKEKTRKMNPSTRKSTKKQGYYIDSRPQTMGWSGWKSEKPSQVVRYSVWFWMRKDGAVATVSQEKGITRVFKNLDILFEYGLDSSSSKDDVMDALDDYYAKNEREENAGRKYQKAVSSGRKVGTKA